MKKFDREALSDCFDSISLADEIRKQFGLGNEAAPLTDIAKAVGVWNIREEVLSSIEGALVVPAGKLEGEIILNSKQIPTRKRFTLAHEIGHLVHPMHHPKTAGQFNCSKEDIFKLFGRAQIPTMENEANEFASQLLIPPKYFGGLVVRGYELDFQEIIEFCDRHEVSKAFAIRKLQPLCKTPTAFVFSFNGIIRYVNGNKFPSLKVWSKDNLPLGCISSESLPDNKVGKKTSVAPSVWLKGSVNLGLHEQIYVQETGYRITMLTLG